MWWGDYGVHKLPPMHMAASELSSGISCLRLYYGVSSHLKTAEQCFEVRYFSCD